MFTVSNVLSLVRGPLAFLFLIPRMDIRVVAVSLAILTDCIDGYLARKYKYTTKFGAILDPAMDKFFVFFAVTVLFFEKSLPFWQILTMLSRDISLFLFSFVLLFQKRIKTYNYRSLVWGKATTSLQFLVLFLIALNFSIPNYLFLLFIGLGFLVLIELFFTLKTNAEKI
jgi:CDP-diacylglycerol--glycerol-3-phosphate 3-phosphatidyltransferase